MRHLDTFSGIGGWALAARWMGWQTQAFVEKDKFCQAVLAKNFAGVPIYDDIFTFSGKPFRDNIDILTGSTPCQPFSQAGKREGSNDERHLFPEFLRVVADVEPRWIVIENVYGLLSIESGQVFEDYHASLESEGYSVQTVCIPASALNAPHRRDRLWIVAHAENDRARRGSGAVRGANGRQDGRVLSELSDTDTSFAARNAESTDGRPQNGFGANETSFGLRDWNEPWTQVAAEFCRMDDVVPNRVDRLKSLGNAIVPSIAYEIFRSIQQYEFTQKP